jgi:5'-nucleotidase
MRGMRNRAPRSWRWRSRRVAALAGVVTALAVAVSSLTPAGADGTQGPERGREPVEIQLLDVSDWHAQLDPLSGVGGAAVLSSYWQADRAANPNTLTLTAGDAFGASPPLSSFFDEVPAILAQRMMGFDADTLGNHNFDRGIDHLQQMVDLARAPAGDQPGEPFRYVSANLRNRDDNLTGVEDFAILEVGGVDVAVIGITNPEAPTLVFPGSFGTIEVTDPVRAAKDARKAARRAGADVFVAITHLGVTGFDEDGNAVGPLIDFARRTRGFDVIFGDHTDVQFEGVINRALVVENRSKGATYSRTTLTVDPRNGRTLDRSNEFVVPTAAAVTPDPAIEAMLQPFRDELSVVFDEPIGVATDTFERGGNIERRMEVPIGNLVSDSIRLRYDTQLAFTNGGGIRAPLPSTHQVQDPTLRRPENGFTAGPWDLVVGDAFAVLPFGNSVVTREVTGERLWQILENGVSAVNPDGTATDGRFPQVSGFRFTFDSTQPAGARVVSVTLADGTPIPPDGTVYTLATNDFVNAGGDGYTMLADGQGATRELMATVLQEHIQAESPITPTVEGRITNLATTP